MNDATIDGMSATRLSLRTMSVTGIRVLPWSRLVIEPPRASPERLTSSARRRSTPGISRTPFQVPTKCSAGTAGPWARSGGAPATRAKVASARYQRSNEMRCRGMDAEPDAEEEGTGIMLSRGSLAAKVGAAHLPESAAAFAGPAFPGANSMMPVTPSHRAARHAMLIMGVTLGALAPRIQAQATPRVESPPTPPPAKRDSAGSARPNSASSFTGASMRFPPANGRASRSRASASGS